MLGAIIVVVLVFVALGVVLGFAFRKKRQNNPEANRHANKVANVFNAWGLQSLDLDGIFEELAMGNKKGVFRRLRNLAEDLNSEKARPKMRDAAKELVAKLIDKGDAELIAWLEQTVDKQRRLRAFDQVAAPNQVDVGDVRVMRAADANQRATAAVGTLQDSPPDAGDDEAAPKSGATTRRSKRA